MKPYQVFARMQPERADRILDAILDEAPGVYTQAVAAAAATMKARPQFMMKQPKDKRAKLIRQALSRVAASPIAEEVLAAYFLEIKNAPLVEWLDALGLEHDEGVLKTDAPDCPPAETLEKLLAEYRKGDDADDRELLLEAFAAQSAIDWPEFERLLGIAN
jgi:hypothetical protein